MEATNGGGGRNVSSQLCCARTVLLDPVGHLDRFFSCVDVHESTSHKQNGVSRAACHTHNMLSLPLPIPTSLSIMSEKNIFHSRIVDHHYFSVLIPTFMQF